MSPPGRFITIRSSCSHEYSAAFFRVRSYRIERACQTRALSHFCSLPTNALQTARVNSCPQTFFTHGFVIARSVCLRHVIPTFSNLLVPFVIQVTHHCVPHFFVFSSFHFYVFPTNNFAVIPFHSFLIRHPCPGCSCVRSQQMEMRERNVHMEANMGEKKM